MSDPSARVTAKLDSIAQNCEPSGFLKLVAIAQDFIAAAGLLCDIYDESEFQKLFSRFVVLMLRFHGAFQQAYDMNLLSGTDQKSRSGSRTLKALDNALKTSDRRIECIAFVCRSAEAAACLIGIKRFPNLYMPWTQMFNLLTERPILAPIFSDVDFAKWHPIPEQIESKKAAWARKNGFLRIDIGGQCIALNYEAGALWAESLIHEFQRDKLEKAAQRVKRLLNFLTIEPFEKWVLQEFLSIGAADSIRAVLHELLRHDPQPLKRGKIDQELFDQGLAVDGELFPAMVVTVGLLRKRNYIVWPPGMPLFVEKLSHASFQNVQANSVQFIRNHYTQVPRSIQVKFHQRQLAAIESAITDVKLKSTLHYLSAHFAGEAFAYVLSSSLGASPEISIFIAGSVGAVVEVAMKLREN